MLLKSELKGILFALVGTISLSVVYLFSKAALNEVGFSLFLLYWFGGALVWNVLFSGFSHQLQTVKQFKRKIWFFLLALGLVETIATGTFFYSIFTIENPSIPSFLRNLEPVFISILAFIILKERFGILDIIGIFFTIGGAFIISYQKDTKLSDVFLAGSEYIIIASFFYAMRTIMVKTIVQKVSPIIITLNRVLFLLFAAFVLWLFSGEAFLIPMKAFVIIMVGSFIGPFFTSIAQNFALKYINASKATMIQSSAGLFTLLGAYIMFASVPLVYQIVGGIFTMIGVIIVAISSLLSQ